ncbi:guanylate kinase [bacterium]|jgi:guanylate kinase|nr:guanylate kinase [bacterium]MBT3795207.1 guanylate kinase [bacterium]MBT4634476.1 guanylate kinase [bacterium]
MLIKGNYLIIISGPSGVGKSTITSKLLASSKNLDFSVSYTTREKRPSELNNDHYVFISRREFEDLINKNAFLEYEEVHGNYYGTPLKPIEDSLKFRHSILLDIDVKGAYNIINTNHFDSISFFIRPPSIETLKDRLTDRGDMKTDQIEKRIIEAKNEIMKSIHFDHLIVNDNFDDCYSEIERILSSM